MAVESHVTTQKTTPRVPSTQYRRLRRRLKFRAIRRITWFSLYGHNSSNDPNTTNNQPRSLRILHTPHGVRHLLRTIFQVFHLMSDEDPLGPPKNEQGLDLSKLSPQGLRIYRMYGKLPTTQQILSSKFQDKKYFDSGDYAMQKQLGGPKSGILGGMSMRHPNAEKVKEIYNRNSISAANSGILFNGKLGLLSESGVDEEEKK